jgi:signal transduction histidine kinase
MGLSICRSIVDGHGGRLWASPAEPHGTALRFTIPAGVEKRGQSNPVQDPAVAGAQALA